MGEELSNSPEPAKTTLLLWVEIKIWLSSFSIVVASKISFPISNLPEMASLE